MINLPATRLAAVEVGKRDVDVLALYRAFEAVCHARGHTPCGIGRRLGINPATMTRCKQGQYLNLGARTALRMCAWAGLQPMDFLR